MSSTMDCLVSAVGERPLGLSDSEDLGCIVSATVGERPLGMKEKWVEEVTLTGGRNALLDFD